MNSKRKKKDFKIKVDDIIVCNKSGYHKVIGIEDRWFGEGWQNCLNGEDEPDDIFYSPLITCVQIYACSGNRVASKKILTVEGWSCANAREVAKRNLDTAQKLYDLLK